MWRGGIKRGIIKAGALINTGRAERKNEANDLNNYKRIRIFVLPFFSGSVPDHCHFILFYSSKCDKPTVSGDHINVRKLQSNSVINMWGNLPVVKPFSANYIPYL